MAAMTDPIAKGKPAGSSAGFAGSAAEHHAKDLRRYLFRRLGNAQDVDDLAQEVYLRLLRMNETQVRKPLAFVFTVAARVLANYRAAASAEKGRVFLDDEAANESTEPVTDALASRLQESASAQEQLEEALAQLSPKQAAMVLMVRRDGRTYKEAAEAFGVSVDTVTYHLQKAQAKLRRLRWQEDGTERCTGSKQGTKGSKEGS